MANLQVGVAGNGTVTVGAGASVHSPASNTLTLGSNNAERFRITGVGSVGIGTDDPVLKLHLHTSDSGNNYLKFTNATTGTLETDGVHLGLGSDEAFNINQRESNDIRLFTAATERLRIDSSGRLLLGTTTEGHDNGDELTISKDSGAMGMTLRSGDSSNCHLYFSDATSGTGEYAGYIAYQHSDNSLQMGTNSAEKLRITSDGSMGLGTTPETDGQANSLYFANGNANIWGSGNVNLYTVVNARYTGSAWKYNNTAVASYVGQQSGVWSFHNAASGTADAAATFTERIRIGTSGEIGIAGANYGSSGQVLTSGGSGSAVSWATAAGGITQADFWRLSSSLQANQLPIASNLERVDTYGFGDGSLLGSGMTESSGVFTFPATGLYWVHAFGNVYSANHSQTNTLQIRYTADGGSNWATASVGAQGIYDQGSDSYGNIGTNALIDVTSTSNVKVAFNFGAGQGGEYLEGHTTYTYTGFIFIRLAAT